MLLFHCRKRLAGGTTPSISWSLWAMRTLILEWTANWQALSFLTMGSVTWTTGMNIPCQLSWWVPGTLSCCQGYKDANKATITGIHGRKTHTWWKQCTFSDLRLTDGPLSVPRNSPIFQRTQGGQTIVQSACLFSVTATEKGAQGKTVVTWELLGLMSQSHAPHNVIASCAGGSMGNNSSGTA